MGKDCQLNTPLVNASIEVYADMMKVKADVHHDAVGGGKREKCSSFSEASRRRMIQKMAQLNLNGYYEVFVTLTYPSVYSPSWQTWKRDLDVFMKWLSRQCPNVVGCLWRVEFQKRGAPHYHLVLICDESVCTCTPISYTDKHSKQKKTKHHPTCKMHAFRSEIAKKWPNVVRDSYMAECDDNAVRSAYLGHYQAHLKAGTNCEQVGSRRQLMAYVAKYVAKVDGGNVPDEWGRTWGFRNLNGTLDFSAVEIVALSFDESVQLKRMVRKWLKSKGKKRYSRMLSRMPSYSILGLGADSENSRVIYRLLGGIRQGLFAPHNSPRQRTSSSRDENVCSIHKRSAILHVAKKAGCPLKRDDMVMTPSGVGRVGVAMLCETLLRWRVSVVIGGVWQTFDAEDVSVVQQGRLAV